MYRIAISIIFMLALNAVVFSQAVTKGSFETGAGLGFGLFQASNNDTTPGTATAASGVLQAHFQYAPIDDISLGLMFQRNGFLTERDSGNKVSSLLAGAGIQFRAVNGENTTLYFGLSGGPAWMHYYNGADSNYVDGEGYWMDFVAGTRYFITHKAGIFVELAYHKQQYSHFDDKNNNLLMVGPYTDRREFRLGLNGMNLRVGLNFKFGGQK